MLKKPNTQCAKRAEQYMEYGIKTLIKALFLLHMEIRIRLLVQELMMESMDQKEILWLIFGVMT